MFKKTVLIILTILIIFGISYYKIIKNRGNQLHNIDDNDDITDYKTFAHTIVTIETENCNKVPRLYYSENDRNIYTYCLDSIKVDNIEDLKDFFTYSDFSINDFINNLVYVDEANDGGTEIFRDLDKTSGGFTNNGLTIVKCHKFMFNSTINTDVYIGPKWMWYEDNFCE